MTIHAMTRDDFFLCGGNDIRTWRVGRWLEGESGPFVRLLSNFTHSTFLLQITTPEILCYSYPQYESSSIRGIRPFLCYFSFSVQA